MNTENTEPQTEETTEEEATYQPPAEESGTSDIDQDVVAVAQQTMVGDLRDVCLQIMKDPKTTGKAWKDMSESEQRDTAEKITDRVEDAVIQGVRIISANGQRQIIGTLEQVTNKDGMKSVIKTSAHDDLRHDLNDNVGCAVAIVLSGAEDYVGIGEKVKFDKDQPELPVDDGELDELFDKAKDMVMSSGKASTSYIQRELQIGYNRAARIIEQLEAEDVISAADEKGKRKISSHAVEPSTTTEGEANEEAKQESYDEDTGQVELADGQEVAALDQESEKLS